jgi:hypothetical protein
MWLPGNLKIDARESRGDSPLNTGDWQLRIGIVMLVCRLCRIFFCARWNCLSFHIWNHCRHQACFIYAHQSGSGWISILGNFGDIDVHFIHLPQLDWIFTHEIFIYKVFWNIQIFHKRCKLVHYFNKGFTWIGEISVSKVHITAFKPAGFRYCQMGYHPCQRGMDTEWLPGHSMEFLMHFCLYYDLSRCYKRNLHYFSSTLLESWKGSIVF